ncbi:MAG TPA: ABC transporter permease [Myxococcales bacterium]
MLLLKLAWRNIWRNVRRTAITLAALSLGVTAIVSLHSFREVAYTEMTRSLTRGLLGHAQVHGLGYQASPEMGNVVADAVAVEAKLARALPGTETERRVLGAGLAGSGESATAAMVMGVEPEKAGTAAVLTIKKGRTLPKDPAHEVVVGTGLAEELHLEPGGELVLVGQAADGSLANDRYTVAGVADVGSTEGNASAVFLHLADAQSFFALGDGVHQIIVRLPAELDGDDLTEPVSLLRGALDLTRVEVLSWAEILPELKSAMDAKRQNQHLVDFIVFLIVSLGVLNTMTMSTFERTREFGVMACLGTRRRRVLGMVVLEALLQGAIGFGLGVVLSWALLYGIGTADLSSLGGLDVMGTRMPGALALKLAPAAVATAALTTLLTMLAGGLLPAIRASRLKPIEATRYV